MSLLYSSLCVLSTPFLYVPLCVLCVSLSVLVVVCASSLLLLLYHTYCTLSTPLCPSVYCAFVPPCRTTSYYPCVLSLTYFVIFCITSIIPYYYYLVNTLLQLSLCYPLPHTPSLLHHQQSVIFSILLIIFLFYPSTTQLKCVIIFIATRTCGPETITILTIMYVFFLVVLHLLCVCLLSCVSCCLLLFIVCSLCFSPLSVLLVITACPLLVPYLLPLHTFSTSHTLLIVLCKKRQNMRYMSYLCLITSTVYTIVHCIYLLVISTLFTTSIIPQCTVCVNTSCVVFYILCVVHHAIDTQSIVTLHKDTVCMFVQVAHCIVLLVVVLQEFVCCLSCIQLCVNICVSCVLCDLRGLSHAHGPTHSPYTPAYPGIFSHILIQK